MMFDPIYNATPTQFDIFNDFGFDLGFELNHFDHWSHF